MGKSVAERSVLIIEDDLDIREALCSLLDMEGYIVNSANNGLDGMKYLAGAKKLPDVILLDLMMPIMNGYQFLEKKSGHSKFHSIPAIVMSADSYLKDQASHMATAYAFVKKPIDVADLLATLQNYNWPK